MLIGRQNLDNSFAPHECHAPTYPAASPKSPKRLCVAEGGADDPAQPAEQREEDEREEQRRQVRRV